MKILSNGTASISPAVGQEVVLRATHYVRHPHNPIWGTDGKYVKGKVESIISNSVYVVWEGLGKNVYYKDGDLEIYSDALLPVVAPVIKTVSIKDAVESVINADFIAQQKSFSAYDITTAVRGLINTGTIRLDGVPFEDINGKSTQRVSHDDVRVHVRNLMDTVSAYSRNFHQGNYLLYSFVGNTQVAAAPLTSPSVTFTPTGVVASPAAPAAVKTTIVSSASSFDNRVVEYVVNRKTATLKQIQSRFKRELQKQPRTVRDLATLATKAGLRIDVKTPYHASVVTN